MKKLIITIVCLLSALFTVRAQEVIRIGIIGLDTSHSTAFTELLNGTSDDPLAREFEVVAAYPYGSTTIPTSRDRIPGYIETVKKFGVEITSSIAELLDKVDCVLLETNDGRMHLEQAVEVFRSGKICYIDKPLGAPLARRSPSTRWPTATVRASSPPRPCATPRRMPPCAVGSSARFSAPAAIHLIPWRLRILTSGFTASTVSRRSIR